MKLQHTSRIIINILMFQLHMVKIKELDEDQACVKKCAVIFLIFIQLITVIIQWLNVSRQAARRFHGLQVELTVDLHESLTCLTVGGQDTVRVTASIWTEGGERSLEKTMRWSMVFSFTHTQHIHTVCRKCRSCSTAKQKMVMTSLGTGPGHQWVPPWPCSYNLVILC